MLSLGLVSNRTNFSGLALSPDLESPLCMRTSLSLVGDSLGVSDLIFFHDLLSPSGVCLPIAALIVGRLGLPRP